MTLQETMRISQELNTNAEALAALGAYLRMTAEGVPVDDRLHAHLVAAIDAIGAENVADLTDAEASIAVGFIRSFLQQALDLVDNPDRDLLWHPTDADHLQRQGQASAVIAPLLLSTADDPGGLPGLTSRLRRPGARICDIGTGVGRLAIAFAESLPATTVVGVDIWEPALALAADNVAAAGLGDRIELRAQDAAELADEAEFDLVFVPGPFLPESAVPHILRRVMQATKPGGWVACGLYGTSDDSDLAAALTAVRIVRSGGHPWPVGTMIEQIVEAGFDDAHLVPRTWSAPVEFVVGQRRS